MTNTIIKTHTPREYLQAVNFFRLQGFKVSAVFHEGLKQTDLAKGGDTVIVYLSNLGA